MKKILSLVLAVAISASLCLCLSGCSSKTKLFVYNVGDYIHPDVIKMFEKENPDVYKQYIKKSTRKGSIRYTINK